MTVKSKTGRKRYIYFKEWKPEIVRKIVNDFDDSRVIIYKGMKSLRVRHDQLPVLRQEATEYGIKIAMVSGTLKALKRKVS